MRASECSPCHALHAAPCALTLEGCWCSHVWGPQEVKPGKAPLPLCKRPTNHSMAPIASVGRPTFGVQCPHCMASGACKGSLHFWHCVGHFIGIHGGYQTHAVGTPKAFLAPHRTHSHSRASLRAGQVEELCRVAAPGREARYLQEML